MIARMGGPARGQSLHYHLARPFRARRATQEAGRMFDLRRRTEVVSSKKRHLRIFFVWSFGLKIFKLKGK
jgi:hypothetical protein